MTSAFFTLLLRDTATLLRPRRVSVLPSTKDLPVDPPADLSSEPCLSALLGLSDLHALFLLPSSTASLSATEDEPEKLPSRPRQDHVPSKLLFYAGQVLGTPSSAMEMLAAEVELMSKKTEKEDLKGSHEASVVNSWRKPEGERKLLVEEIV